MMERGGETEAALRDAAKRLQSMGRNGDTLLAHITPAEARLLDAVTDGGSINPTTGLLEFWDRMGGNNYGREQRDKAETRAASLGGKTEHNTQNDGGGSRQKTYTDIHARNALELVRQQRFDHRPLKIRQIKASHRGKFLSANHH